jgi:proline-specific peptidase
MEASAHYVQGPAGVLSVEQTGSADNPPLVAVHGGPGISPAYMKRMSRLGELGLRFLLYAQRGVGGSAAPSDSRYDLDAYVADLDAVCEWAGDRVVLLGHSWGGVVCQAYMAAHPERVRGCLLVGSGPPTHAELARGGQRLNARIRALQNEGTLPATLTVPDDHDTEGTDYLQLVMPAYLGDPSMELPPEVRGTRSDVRVNRETEQQVRGYDLRSRLAEVTVPSLIVHGEQDPFGIEVAHAVQRALPSAEPRIEWLRCGHMPWIEDPEAFRSAVEPFLRQVLGGS